MSKVLSIDFGLKRIGFAVGNPQLGVANPIAPIIYKDFRQVIAHIQYLMTDYDVSRIVIGYPVNMDGSRCPMTQHVEHFTQRLKKSLAPFDAIEYVDERLSSLEADEELKAITPNPKKRKVLLDSMAAVILLNRYMESAENSHYRYNRYDSDDTDDSDET